jgi:exonuclease SbcD
MRILHSSDWHIGRTLYGRKRYEEFEAFLTWLAETIQQNEIDACWWRVMSLTPALRAIAPKSSITAFLCRVAASSCRHVVVVAGNHDSPSFLNAPKELLKALRCPRGR